MGGYVVKAKNLKHCTRITATLREQGYEFLTLEMDELSLRRGTYKRGWVYVNTDTGLGYTYWSKLVVKFCYKSKLKEVPHAPRRVVEASESCTCRTET